MTEQMKALLAQFGGDGYRMWKATGILPSIAGAANPEGYNQTDDILRVTVDGVPLNDLYAEFIDSVNILNAQRAPLISFLSFPVDKPFEEVMPITSAEFEEADEFGQPKGIRLGTPWNMGYDLKYMDLGIRYTFRFLGRAPSEELRALNNSALEADQRLVMKTVLERIFRNITDSATLEASGRAVSVYPFYNGDQTALPVAPPTWKSHTFADTHTHYLQSGAGTFVSDDLDDSYDHIHHHGYTQGGAKVIVLMNRQEAKIARTFRVADGDSFDFIPVVSGLDATFRGTLVGALPSGAGAGPDVFPGVFGYYGGMWLVEEDYIPAGYLVMLASGGKFNDRNPVGIREHENAALRGLKLIPQFERYPLRESFYHHAIGSGVRHPAAGVVTKIGSSGYSIPTLELGGQGGR